jgi:hypothetical protein
MTFRNSVNHSEKKDNLGEIVPVLVDKIPKDLTNLIAGYIDFREPTWLTLSHHYTFLGVPSAKKQILISAELGAPLEDMDSYIRKAHARDEVHLPEILRQAINKAIINLDQDYDKLKINEGMAERLFKLYAELYPSTLALALRQARLAAPREDEATRGFRVAANMRAVQKVFAAFENDANIPEAIDEFKAFVRSLKPETMRDKIYHLNLLQLVYLCFYTLALYGCRLPQTEKDWGRGLNGKLAELFRFEVIGAIQSELPPRIEQILEAKLCGMLENNQKITRTLKAVQSEVKPCYYDHYGRHDPREGACASEQHPAGIAKYFLNLIAMNETRTQKLLYSRYNYALTAEESKSSYRSRPHKFAF